MQDAVTPGLSEMLTAAVCGGEGGKEGVVWTSAVRKSMKGQDIFNHESPDTRPGGYREG